MVNVLAVSSNNNHRELQAGFGLSDHALQLYNFKNWYCCSSFTEIYQMRAELKIFKKRVHPSALYL